MRRLLLTTAVLVATFLGGPASAALAAEHEQCPELALFPFAIPSTLIPPGLLPGPLPPFLIGTITTAESGTFPICTGSFVVVVAGIGTIAGGDFRAVHGGGHLSAKFEGVLASPVGPIAFEGKLKFSSATGMGSVRAEFSLPDGTELRIKLEFLCNLSGCGPTSPPVVTIH